MSLDENSFALPFAPLHDVVGFRLRRFEVKNFGGYSGRASVFNFNGESAVLTGENGVGKSTVVDAWRLLFRKQPQFNSAGQGSKDRTIESYYVGKFGTQDGGRSLKLRSFSSDKTRYMGICAVFEDQDGAVFSAVRLGHASKSGSLNWVLITARGDVSLEGDFPEFPTNGVASRKAESKNGRLHTTLDAFFEELGRTFGLKGLEQVRQTFEFLDSSIGVKATASIGNFAQAHIFPRLALEEETASAIAEFEKLQEIRRVVEESERQIVSLKNVEAEFNRYDTAIDKRKAMLAQGNRFPQFVHQVARLDARRIMNKMEKKKEQQEGRIKKIEDEISALKNDVATYQAQLDDKGVHKLQALERELEIANEKLEFSQETHQKLTQVLSQIGVKGAPKSATELARFEDKVRDTKAAQEEDLAKQDAERDRLTVVRSDAKREQSEAQNRVASLEQNKTALDGALVRVREALADELGLSREDVPFVAELLQIRAGEEAWEGVANRVLGGLGTEILVETDHASRARRFINASHWGARVVMREIGNLSPEVQEVSADALANKLAVNTQSKFYQVAQSLLNASAGHACLDEASFASASRDCVTQAGSVKSGRRIIKDDRRKVSDRSSYILGWNTGRALEEAKAVLSEVSQRLEKAQRELTEHKSGESVRLERINKAKNLLDNWPAFSDIDVATVQKKIEGLNENITRLRSPEIANLQQLQNDALSKMKTLEDERAEVNQDLGKTKGTLDASEQEVQRRLADEAKEAEIHGPLEREHRRLYISYLREELVKREGFSGERNVVMFFLKRFEGRTAESLSTVRRLNDEKSDPSKSLSARRSASHSAVVQALKEHPVFGTKLSGDPNVLFAPMDNLDKDVQCRPMRQEWRDELARIERDDIARHKKEYETAQRTAAQAPVSVFEGAVRDYDKGIQAMIAGINDVLVKLPYDHMKNSRVRFRARAITNNPTVSEFKKALSEAVVSASSGNYEVIEDRVEKLLACLHSDDTAASQQRRANLLDLRTWYEMDIEEYVLGENGERQQLNVYSSKNGFSGGQGERMTMLLLGAALRYTFEPDARIGKVAGLRTIILDEAFSKATPETALLATRILIDLGLQVIIATPSEKVQVLNGENHKVFLTIKENEVTHIVPMTYSELKRSSSEGLRNLEAEIAVLKE
mgnify:CR=1 FL=1